MLEVVAVYITAFGCSVHQSLQGREADGAVLKLKVDLGNCYKCKGGKLMKQQGRGPDDMPMRKDWMNHGYDSCWSPAGYGGVRGEHCVRDPKRIQVVDVYLMDTVKAGDAGYRVVTGAAGVPEAVPPAGAGGMKLSDGTLAMVGLRVVAIASSSRGHYASGHAGVITKLNPSDPVVRWDHASGQEHQTSKGKLKRE